MTSNLQSSITKFFAEAKLLEGAEDAILELSDECANCIRLTGRVYDQDTHDKIIDIGKKYDLLVLAHKLNVRL
jgi:multimeric flavodoxin WrbA